MVSQVYPFNILKWFLATLLAIIWMLALVGYLTGEAAFYRWAGIVVLVLVLISVLPIVALGVTVVLERTRNRDE